MKQDLINNTEKLIEYLGGRGNIISAGSCMTRLRVTVRDEGGVNEKKIASAEDVLGLVHDREGYYEIVVGPGKSRKYADLFRENTAAPVTAELSMDMGIEGQATVSHDKAGPKGAGQPSDWKDNKKRLRDGQKDNCLKSGLKLIGDIFVPLIPGTITAGLCAGFAALIAQAVPDFESIKAWSIAHSLLTLVNASFMSYITAWAGYRAAERFGATPIIGGMLGMITSLDGINQISALLGLFNDADPLNSILRTGKGGVLAVIAGVYILSKLEKKIRSLIPESIDIIFTPMLSLLICAIPYILVIMPLFGYISNGIVWVFSGLCMSENLLIRIIAGYVSTALFLPLVAAGMHHGLVALYTVQLEELGYVTLYPALAMAGAGQVGAAIALWIKAKKAGAGKMCSVIMGALPAGILGIGEPLIYGVTLPLGRPFITAGLGAGFGGALVIAFEVASTTWGPSGLLGAFVMTAGPLGALKSVLVYLLGILISYICSFLITYATFRKETLLPYGGDSKLPYGGDSQLPCGGEQDAAKVSAIEEPDITKTAEVEEEMLPRAQEGAGNGTGGNRTVRCGETVQLRKAYAQSQDIYISAPADGEMIPMGDIPDPVFSSGTMGDCIGIAPENGNIYAPCDGTVSFVAETGHAIAFTATDGRELLIHVGIDTVKLGGRGFKVLKREGSTVSRGDKVLIADLSIIAEAGLSAIVITACPDGAD